eukprot:2158014-Alexandrium_andersonii.AAC.1
MFRELQADSRSLAREVKATLRTDEDARVASVVEAADQTRKARNTETVYRITRRLTSRPPRKQKPLKRKDGLAARNT